MENVTKVLASGVTNGKTPSAQYVFFSPDTIIFEYAAGFGNLKTNLKADRNTTYNAFSLTKTFTALSVLQLLEKGLVVLDKPIRKYLDGATISDNVTVRHLLTHTAGLANPLPLSWIHLPSEHNTFNRDEFYKPILEKAVKTQSTPGTKFKYSNLGYLFLGQLIEAVSGLSYEEYIRKNIIDRLDLDAGILDFNIPQTGFHAVGYHKKMSFSMLLLGLFLDKSEFMEESIHGWKPFRQNYVTGAPYGGIIGNSFGFVKYGQELLKEKGVLLQDEVKRLLFNENITSTGKNTGMCLSWFKGKVEHFGYYAHAGGGGGYYCELRLYPELKRGSFIVFNRSGFSDERYLDNVDIHILKE